MKFVVKAKITEEQADSFRKYLKDNGFTEDQIEQFTGYALSENGMNFKSSNAEDQNKRAESLKKAGFTNLTYNSLLDEKTPETKPEEKPLITFAEDEKKPETKPESEPKPEDEKKPETKPKVLEDKEPSRGPEPAGCRYNSTIIVAILVFAFLGAMFAGWCLFKTPSAATNQNAVISAMQSEKGQAAIQSGVEKGLSSKIGQTAIKKAVGESIDEKLTVETNNKERQKRIDELKRQNGLQ